VSDRPRWWKSDALYAEVKKCIDDMFFLVPTPELRNIIGACLGRAQARFPVKIYWVDPNVNHLHRGRSREPFSPGTGAVIKPGGSPPGNDRADVFAGNRRRNKAWGFTPRKR
jgi:hypothetical protein